MLTPLVTCNLSPVYLNRFDTCNSRKFCQLKNRGQVMPDTGRLIQYLAIPYSTEIKTLFDYADIYEP
jgi:hypothetical protein